MKHRLLQLFLILTLFISCESLSAQKKNFESAVRIAVETQMRNYPKSTLKDIYKNFFQDKYGPGHLVADTSRAGNYIREEMASYTDCDGEIAEPTGWEGNFYRVNLSVIKENKIAYPIFFDAFIRSVNGIKPMPVEEWTKEWREIEKIIEKMNLELPNYVADKKDIEKNLQEGNYVGHHSKLFEQTYSPHYRIISKQIFEEELKPLLK